MKNLRLITIGLMMASSISAYALEKSEKVRMYVLNCGRMDVSDMAIFSDTGEYDGKPGYIEDPCFLIQHPKGLLLWDLGLGDHLVGKAPAVNGVFKSTVSVSLVEQLAKLGLAPKDIQYIAFSHTHGDHTGNANLFKQSTWLWQDKELAHILAKPTPGGVWPESVSGRTKAKQTVYHGDHDVFGDGKVKILSTPGHTPGHQCLLVRLSGTPVILSGDLYHLKENRKQKRVPVPNVSRADTLASMDRVEKIAKHLDARVIIQHDAEEFASLPQLPGFME